MACQIETNQWPDGRWVAMAPAVPGLLVYGHTEEETRVAARELAAILQPEDSENRQRILAFYPGRIPDPARAAGQPLEGPPSKVTL
jgi:predicted RNase H-like HicB family nuclease